MNKISFSSSLTMQGMTMKKILDCNFDNRQLVRQPKNLTSFVKEHVSDFLDLALDEKGNKHYNSYITSESENEEIERSQKSFMILSNSPKNVMDSLLTDNLFFIKVTRIMPTLSCNSFSILAKNLASRISSIFLNLFNKEKDVSQLFDSIGFMPLLLKYVGDQMVFELFHFLFSQNDDLTEMQNCIYQINIGEFILGEMENESLKEFFDDNESDNSSVSSDDQSVPLNKKNNLCLLIKDCFMNPILRPSVLKAKILLKLCEWSQESQNIVYINIEDFANHDSELLLFNNIWNVISLFPTKTLANSLSNLFTFALEAIQLLLTRINDMKSNSEDASKLNNTPFVILKPYHIYMIDFISQVMKIQTSLLTVSVQASLKGIFNQIIDTFPNSTHVISSIFRIVKSSLVSIEFGKKFIESLMPKLIQLAKQETRNAAAAAATHFLADLDKTKSASVAINRMLNNNEQYMDFYDTYFKHYLEDAYTPYGGPVFRFIESEKLKFKKQQKKINKRKKAT